MGNWGVHSITTGGSVSASEELHAYFMCAIMAALYSNEAQ